MALAVKQEGKVNEKISVSAIKGVSPTSAEGKYRAEDMAYVVAALTGHKVSSVLMVDLFNMLFLPSPQLTENYPQENKDYFETISNLLQQLNKSGFRVNTVANAESSTAAAINLAINLIKALEEMAKQQGQNGEGQEGQQGQQGQQGQTGQQNSNGMQDQSGQGQPSPGQPGQSRGQSAPESLQSLSDRTDAAELLQKLIEQSTTQQQLKDLMDQLKNSMANRTKDSSGSVPEQAAQNASNMTGKEGADPEKLKQQMDMAGHGAGTLDFNQHDPLVDMLFSKTNIRNLIKLLNGSPNASSESKEKARFSRGEYNGFTIGGDFAAAVPSAFAYPDELLYALYAHRRLPKYDRSIRENEKTRYVLFDKSSSMSADKLIFAKAVALSLYISAVKEKGDFYLTYFDDVVYDPITVLKNERRDKKDMVAQLMSRVAVSGGTNIEKAVIAACNDLAKDRSRKKKEIILITDGEAQIDMVNLNRHLAEAKADLITVYINRGNNMSDYVQRYLAVLQKVSKHFFFIENADKGELIKLVSSASMR